MSRNRLVIATHNAKKAGEMVTILSSRFPSLEILTLADFPGAPEPEETGTTYAENARIKAVSGFEFTGETCLADDAGLEIDYFDGAPGVYSKRFLGEDSSFAEKMGTILERMEGVPVESRGARFRCHISVAGRESDRSYRSDKSYMSDFHAICEGRIADQMSGNGGFGYDPIFWLPELSCTMADLTADQKHAISHRGKVLREFADAFESLLIR